MVDARAARVGTLRRAGDPLPLQKQEALGGWSALPDDQPLSAGFLRTYLRSRGLQAFLIKGTLLDLEREVRQGRPVLVGVVNPYLNSSYAYYQVVIGFNRAFRQLAVIDPADGFRAYSFEAFAQEWGGAQELALVVRAHEPTGSQPRAEPPRTLWSGSWLSCCGRTTL